MCSELGSVRRLGVRGGQGIYWVTQTTTPTRGLRRKNTGQSAEETMSTEKVGKFLHITQITGVQSLKNTMKLTIC